MGSVKLPMTTYKESGVDVELGNKCSQIMYKACQRTFINRKNRVGEPIKLAGGFSGPIRLKGVGRAILVKNSDGVGTKVDIASFMNRHHTIGFDLLAMICDDAASMGAEPIAVTNTLNVKKLSLPIVKQLARGLVEGAKVAQVAVVGGEIAELGDKINHGYIWDGDVVAISPQAKWHHPQIKPGDHIVGIASDGFRSNGYSLIRKILSENLGPEWYRKDYNRHESWGEVTLKPSRIYTPFLVDCFGTYHQPPSVSIKKVAHITGGGLIHNLGRILPTGLGATIEPLRPHEPMLALQKMGNVPDQEAYRTWNMGVGLCIVTPDQKVLQKCATHNLRAKIIGEVRRGNRIEISNRGYFQKKSVLKYEIN